MAKIKASSEQSTRLAAIRDALLPKLLSGEIRVAEAERFAAGERITRPIYLGSDDFSAFELWEKPDSQLIRVIWEKWKENQRRHSSRMAPPQIAQIMPRS